MAINNRLLRIPKRIWEELRATAKIARVVSIKGALSTFLAKVDIQIMNRNGFYEYPAAKKRLMEKHQVMNTYFEKTFQDYLSDYEVKPMAPVSGDDCQNRIWVCWWQGLERAPELVKACVESLQKNAADHVVTVITEENYRDFVQFPDWIEEKFRAGMITRTNYSDLLRLSLLAQYGGMWLDATFFCSGRKFDDYFREPLWTIKRPDYQHASVACGYFAGYSLCCTYENRWVFATVRDLFLHYWQTNDMLIDYLLIDYMIVLAQRMDERIADEFRKVAPNNRNCDELIKVLNQPYDEAIWTEMKKDTALFKLSWKQEYALEKDGKETFYAKLLKGEL